MGYGRQPSTHEGALRAEGRTKGAERLHQREFTGDPTNIYVSNIPVRVVFLHPPKAYTFFPTKPMRAT